MALVSGGLPIVFKSTNRYSKDSNKYVGGVFAEDWRLIMDVYMNEYKNHTRDK